MIGVVGYPEVTWPEHVYAGDVAAVRLTGFDDFERAAAVLFVDDDEGILAQIGEEGPGAVTLRATLTPGAHRLTVMVLPYAAAVASGYDDRALRHPGVLASLGAEVVGTRDLFVRAHADTTIEAAGNPAGGYLLAAAGTRFSRYAITPQIQASDAPDPPAQVSADPIDPASTRESRKAGGDVLLVVVVLGAIGALAYHHTHKRRAA